MINGELQEGYYSPADSASHAGEELHNWQESRVASVGDVGLVLESHPHLEGFQWKRRVN